MNETGLIEVEPWIEAEQIAEPVKPKNLDGCRVLVRRRRGSLLSPGGDEIHFMPSCPVISLFTGIGGFDIGIEQAGFTVLVQHELDEACCATLIANRPAFFRHAALIQGDIFATPTSLLLQEADLRVGEPYMVIGGPPCQGFSIANSNRGKAHDDRNDLVFEFLRVVREAQPRFFLFENVPGFQNLNGGEYLAAFLQKAYEGYFELVYGLVDACEHGVPQYRTRFICAGTRRDLVEIDGTIASLPKATHFSQLDLDQIHLLETGPLFRKELNLYRHAPGIRYFPDRPVLQAPAPLSRKAGDPDHSRSYKYVEFYRKLERDEPERVVHAPTGGC